MSVTTSKQCLLNYTLSNDNKKSTGLQCQLLMVGLPPRVCCSEPLVDQTSQEGAVPRIQHASAEEFIHIFVNNAAQLTEFLEHMVEVTLEKKFPLSSSLNAYCT